MSIEAHADCRYDRLELRDGSDENATLLGQLCGQDVPVRRFKSSSNVMFIRFVSDPSLNELGFNALLSATYGSCSSTTLLR